MRILSVPVLFLSDLSSCDFIPDDDKRRKSVLLRIMMTVVGGSGLLFGKSLPPVCTHQSRKMVNGFSNTYDRDGTSDHYLWCAGTFFAMRSTDFETCALKNTYGRWRSEISYPHILESPIIPVPLGYTFDPSSIRFLENEWSCLVSPPISLIVSRTPRLH